MSLRKLAFAVVAGLVATVAGPVGAAPQKDPVVLPAVQVTADPRPGRAYNQPQLVVDPRDERTLAIVGANYNAGECVAEVSVDGGRTWRAGKGIARPPQYATCVRSDLGPYIGGKFGADGTLYLTSAADNFGGQQDVNDLYVARSDDLGDTWDFSIVHKGKEEVDFPLRDGTTKKGGEHFSLIRMGVDPNDARYVYAGARYQQADRTAPFGTFGNIGIRNMIASSADGGRTWFGPVDPMADVPRSEIWNAYVPSISVGPDGTVYSFTRERTPPADPNNPATATSPAGFPGAGGRLLMSISHDHGHTWTTKSVDDSPVPCGARDRCQWIPEGTVDQKTGNVYVVFAQAATPTAHTDIFFKRSTDGGKTWDEKVKLNDDTSELDQYFPGISVAPNGRVDVAWHDFRSDAELQPGGKLENELYWDVYYTSSSDGGKTWAKNSRISDRTMNRNEGYTMNTGAGLMGPMGVASTDAAAYVAWADSRRGSVALPTEDYYFTSVVYDGKALGPVTSSGTSGAAWFVLGGAVVLAVAGALLLLVSRRVPRS